MALHGVDGALGRGAAEDIERTLKRFSALVPMAWGLGLCDPAQTCEHSCRQVAPSLAFDVEHGLYKTSCCIASDAVFASPTKSLGSSVPEKLDLHCAFYLGRLDG